MDEDKIVIQQRMGKSLAFIFASIMIVIILIWVLFTDLRGEGSGINYYILNHEISYIVFKFFMGFSALFFLIALIYFVKRVILNKPLLVVDESGVYDNTSMFSVGKIKWEDIEGFYVGYQLGKQFIEIKLLNEDCYFPNKFKKYMANSNKKLGHELVCINLSTAKEKEKEIFPKMCTLLKKYKGENNK